MGTHSIGHQGIGRSGESGGVGSGEQGVETANPSPQPYPPGSAGGEVWPRVSSRPARLEDLPYLQARLAAQTYFENHDLRHCIVYVAEYDGVMVGFSAARLQWQVEPVMLFPEFQQMAPRFAQRKATYLLIREIDSWIADRERNTTGIHYYFCYILGRTMQQLATAFGMLRIYDKPGGKFFARDV